MPENTCSDNSQLSGETTASYMKYFSQYNDSAQLRSKILPVNRIGGKGIYLANKPLFDALAAALKENHIDAVKYVDFLVKTFNVTSKTLRDKHLVAKHLLDASSIKDYIVHEHELLRYDKIYGYFMKTVNNIVKDCHEMGIATTKAYFDRIVRLHKLASYYITGRISIYYLAAIPKMKQLIEKLDQMSKNELMHLYLNFEKYNADISIAFTRKQNTLLNPFRFTDDAIAQTSK